MQGHHPSPMRASVTTRTLRPGELYCDRRPQCLDTMLGSCVSVCLWDQRLHFGGMNHFLLPNRPSNGERSPRFGDVAVPELIEAMVRLGSDIRDLQAKLFGGAYVLRAGAPEYAVGRRNVEVAIAELRRRRIPIVASRLSGTQGMVIRQCTDCGDVWVRLTGAPGKRKTMAAYVQDLPTVFDDGAAAGILTDEDGMPIAIRTGRAAGEASGCPTCFSSPLGWRRT